MVFLRYVRVYARVSSRNPAAVGTRSSPNNRGAIQLSFPFFHFCYAVCRCCVPVSHHKFFTLWQPQRKKSSRTPRYSFCGRYERCFLSGYVCALCRPAVLNTRRDNLNQHSSTLNPALKSIRAVRHGYNSSSSSGATTPVNPAPFIRMPS